MGTAALPLEAVAERDVDLLLLEELTVSDDFARWFVAQAFSNGTAFQRVESVRHSVSEASGESDLELLFVSTDGQRIALLIEDKISAPAQPEQADRYRQRAARGLDGGSWSQVRTCIVAPRAYLAASKDAQRYDAKISYEDVLSWFRGAANGDRRATYRAHVMEAALEQARRGYVLVKDEAVTAFWRGYWEQAVDLFPELEMEPPKDRGSQTTWITFRPKGLAARRVIFHKLTAGAVDLQTELAASRVEELGGTWKVLLAPDMSIVATGKSLSVRTSVPSVDVRGPFATQVAEARQGMRAAYRLLYLSRALVAPR